MFTPSLFFAVGLLGCPDATPPNLDADGDGFDTPADCDPNSAAIHPGATEVLRNGVDDDCNPATADDDADGDGYGGLDDCNEANATAYVGAPEIPYDQVDNDCDPSTPDNDLDGDASLVPADCDDTNPGVYPGAYEAADGLDTDCDGVSESAPTAVAEYSAESSLTTCSPIRLDGSKSSDPEGTALTFAWELAGAPTGSALTTVDILQPTDASPLFYADVAGTYTFTLVVDDGGAQSVPSSFALSVAERTTNTGPVASAGADQSIAASVTCTPSSYAATYDCPFCEEAVVTLDAAGSTDPDGDQLTYVWTVVEGVAGGTLSWASGSGVTLTVAGPSASYGASTTETVGVAVVATDCMSATATDIVVVSYVCTGI